MEGLRLSHYLVAVRSIEVAREGYERLLGMRELASGEDAAEGARWLALGGSTEGVRLVEPSREGGPLDAVMRARAAGRNPGGEGFYRGVWETDLLDELVGRLRAAGVAPERVEGGAIRLDARRTLGVRMEIREAPPRAAPAARDDGELLRLSHIGVAVRSHEAAVATAAELFGMRTVGSRQEIPSAALATQWVGFGTRRIFTLLQPLSAESPVAARMRALTLDAHTEGEGVYIVAWAARDTDALGDAIEAAGAPVARTSGPTGTILRPHPRVTGGAYIEVLPLSMNEDQWT
jgi:catechol 2,3-dioxygenase-like lactoylglutathione lyase family enzyme